MATPESTIGASKHKRKRNKNHDIGELGRKKRQKPSLDDDVSARVPTTTAPVQTLTETERRRRKQEKQQRKRNRLAKAAKAPDNSLVADDSSVTNKEELHATSDVIDDEDTRSLDKFKRQERRKKKADNAEMSTSRAEQGSTLVKVNGSANDTSKHTAHDASTTSKSVDHRDSTWSLSRPRGGEFFAQEPMFIRNTNGDDYLITAMGSEAQVLAVSDSLVTASLQAPKGVSILSIDAILTADENLVRILYSNGVLVDWDWERDTVDESKLAAKNVKICRLAANERRLATALVSVIQKPSGPVSKILLDGIEVYQTTHVIDEIRLLAGIDIVFAFCPTVLVFGSKLKSDDYAWVEIPIEHSNSFDIRYVENDEAQRKGHHLSLVLGQAAGQIHYFSDISAIVVSGQTALPRPQVLHWHRGLLAVKFSKDGQYLISGGEETTLVLWQLATGVKSFLPNLTANIMQIVVNTPGNKYALRMADNSIMVLSTSELKPLANFTGLQLGMRVDVDGVTQYTAVMDPKRKNCLLSSVPASQPKHTEPRIAQIVTRPFLQTVDVACTLSLSRQALTRNNVTDFNVNPYGAPIDAPDVRYMAISSDGQWLASVDEWEPPLRDLEHNLDFDAVEEQQNSRRETHLKFWKWDASSSQWMLSTRIDGLHARHGDEASSVATGGVLGLISESTQTGFITIGEDAKLNVWRPAARSRHGIALVDAQGQPEVEWRCKQVVELGGDVEPDEHEPESQRPSIAGLAVSEDGSLLAASLYSDTDDSTDTAPGVYLVNGKTGVVESCRYNLAIAGPLALAFVDRYLILASARSLRVLDVVNDSLHHAADLLPSGQAAGRSGAQPMLAVNSNDGAVAVISPPVRESAHYLTIYDVQKQEVSWQVELDQPAATLVANGTHGFTIVYQDSSISTLSRATKASFLEPKPRILEDDTSLAANGNGTKESAVTLDVGPKNEVITSQVEDDRAVVRPEQLAEVFGAGSNSLGLPSVRDMFHAVAGLFGRSTRPKSVEV